MRKDKISRSTQSGNRNAELENCEPSKRQKSENKETKTNSVECPSPARLTLAAQADSRTNYDAQLLMRDGIELDPQMLQEKALDDAAQEPRNASSVRTGRLMIAKSDWC